MRVRNIVLAAVGSIGVVLSVAGPSNAATTAAWDCPAERLCVWTGANGTGTRAVFAYGDVNLASAPGPSGMNNRITSYRNNTGRPWSFHDGINYNGTTRYAPQRAYGNVGATMDNKTSSIKRLSTVAP